MFQALMTMADESVRQLHDAQARLLQGAASTPGQAPDPAHLAHLPLKHLSAFHTVLGNMAARQVHLSRGLLASAFQPVPDASVLIGALQMQQAILQRLTTQQTQFLQDLTELVAGAGSIGKANTMSKLMDQEYDFFAQFNALLTGQATALMELMESAQIGYGVLFSRKAAGEAG